MNDIKETLQELVNYYDLTRGAGHTHGMMNGVKNTTDSLVMAHNTSFADGLRKTLPVNIAKSKNISFVSIQSNKSLRGRKSPLFIDNAALHMIFKKALNQFNDLEMENIKLLSLNASLNDKIRRIQEILG